MDSMEFMEKARDMVIEYYNNRVEVTDQYQINEENVYIVWLASTLGNNKALLSTTVSDGMYYEITYDNNKDKLYFDAYKKWDHHEYEI